MAAKLGCNPTPFYEEIEPFCRWRRGEESDVLEVHLPAGSKKEQLKVQINNLGILTITGECPVDDTKWIRFRKETKVSKDSITKEVRAKFSKGILRIIIPKTNPLVQTGTGKPRQEGVGEQETAAVGLAANGEGCSRFSMLNPRENNFLARIGKKTTAGIAVVAVVVVAAVVGAVKTYQHYHQSHTRI